jgi:hypothetical protein
MYEQSTLYVLEVQVLSFERRNPIRPPLLVAVSRERPTAARRILWLFALGRIDQQRARSQEHRVVKQSFRVNFAHLTKNDDIRGIVLFGKALVQLEKKKKIEAVDLRGHIPRGHRSTGGFR